MQVPENVLLFTMKEYTIEFTPPSGKRLRLKIQAYSKAEAIETLKAAIWDKTEIHSVESPEQKNEKEVLDFLNKIMGK